jgi:hypothetical protein
VLERALARGAVPAALAGSAHPKPATDKEEIMRVTGITANLPVAGIETASEFYREYLGLSVEAMNLG